MRTRYANSIIREKHANVLTLHLASLDHIEHDTGPGSAKAFAALEEIDKMVATLEGSMRSVARNPPSVLCRITAWREWTMNSI